MDSIPLLSIILPVYNAASTLPLTLAALRAQVYTNLEIIAIDDGSSDSSATILDKAAEVDVRIRVFHIPNGGVWNARKLGIAVASGVYIGFCDSDDIPFPQMYDRLVKEAMAASADITICAFHRKDKKMRGRSTEMAQFGDSTFDVTQDPGILPYINTALWNKLFFAPVLKNDFAFDLPPRVLEDMMLLFTIYPSCKTLAFISEPLYQYTVDSGSAMAAVDIQELNHIIRCMRQTRAWIVGATKDETFIGICDLMAFIHLGLSVPLRLRCKNMKAWCKQVRIILSMLDISFPNYKKTPYATPRYLIKNRMLNVRVLLALWCKKLHILPFTLLLYRFLNNIMKMQISW